jgi:hypothetical protein
MSPSSTEIGHNRQSENHLVSSSLGVYRACNTRRKIAFYRRSKLHVIMGYRPGGANLSAMGVGERLSY